MRLVSISDLHGSLTMLTRILDACGRADVVVLAGDITHFGTPEEAVEAARICRQTGATVLTVTGNCDDEAIEARLVREGCSISGSGRIVDGVGFLGVPSASFYHRDSWEVKEETLAAWIREGHRQVAGASPLVMVPHAPPFGAVDRSRSGAPGGSRAVRSAVEEIGPDLVLCGHIHEARGMERLGGTVVVNCGVGGAGEYAIAEIGELVSVRLCAV